MRASTTAQSSTPTRRRLTSITSIALPTASVSSWSRRGPTRCANAVLTESGRDRDNPQGLIVSRSPALGATVTPVPMPVAMQRDGIRLHPAIKTRLVTSYVIPDQMSDEVDEDGHDGR